MRGEVLGPTLFQQTHKERAYEEEVVIKQATGE